VGEGGEKEAERDQETSKKIEEQLIIRRKRITSQRQQTSELDTDFCRQRSQLAKNRRHQILLEISVGNAHKLPAKPDRRFDGRFL
jgi:hypothetical protein